jgi:hypothetical protein
MVWQHLSPLAWKHINLVGSSHFTEVNLQEEFRPLRDSERLRKRLDQVSASLDEATRQLEEQSNESSSHSPVQLSLLETGEIPESDGGKDTCF